MSRSFLAWTAERDAPSVAPIEAALGERQTRLVRFDPTAAQGGEGAVLVVFLSDELLTTAGERLTEVVAGWRGTVVVVLVSPLMGEAPEALERIAWIRAEADPIDMVAGRIALSGRTSPGWLLAWQEIRVAAERAAAGDRSALLDQDELDRALETTGRRPADVLPEVPPQVKALIVESRLALRRRRQRRLALAVAAAVVFVGVGLLALAQRNSADAARGRAEAATKRAEADRLARLAVQGLDADPDLPVLLARRAYRLDPAPEIRESLRETLDAVPWHRSYRLSVAPRQVVGAQASPLVVVAGADGSATLIDSRSGRVLAARPRPQGARGVPVAAISADGRLVALAYEGGTVEVRRLDRRFGPVWSGRPAGSLGSEPHALAWLGDGRLLMAWDGQPALALDLPTGGTERVPGGIADPRALAVSADGRLVAIGGKQGTAILRAGPLRPCWHQEKEMPDGLTATFDRRRGFLYVGRDGAVGMQIPVPGSCATPAEAQPETRAVISSYSDVAAALPGGGIATGSDSGEITLLEPPATYAAGRFRAHTAGVAGVAVAGDALVTAGDDGWLRVWRMPALPIYPLGPARLVSFYESFGQFDARGTWRPMIAASADGSRVTMGGLSSGSVAVLRADRLAEPLGSYRITIGSTLRPAAADPCAVLLFDGEAALYRCRGEQLKTVWSHDFTEAGAIFESALSDDGRLVAVAGHGALALAEVPDGRVRHLALGDLEALGFDREDRLFVFDGDGSVLEVPPGDGGARRVTVPLGGCRLAAAGALPSGRRALLVCVNGQAILADTANGSVVSRFSAGTDMSAARGIRFSASGRLAVLVGSDGYRVIDLKHRRVAAEGAGGGEEIGSEPRDGTFVGGDRSVLVLRADEGLTRVHLAPWRFLDGDALLEATEAAVPRRLRAGEEPAASGSEGP